MEQKDKNENARACNSSKNGNYTSCTITGRVENLSLDEEILYLNPNVQDEQIATAKKNIIKKFASCGITKDEITFEQK